MNWAEKIVEAEERIRPLVRETPLEQSVLIGDHATRLFLKLEHLQRTGSFKFRGATNKISVLSPEEARAGVVTASNGNHALAVAAAARAKGVGAEVFVSSKVSRDKLHRIENYGAKIRHVGDDPLTSEMAAREEGRKSGRTYVSPYNDTDVIAGQGTIGVEIHQQLKDVDAVFVAVGGGGLIGGIGAYLKAVSPKTKIVGCWPENSPVMYECLKAGRIVTVPEQPSFSESTEGNLEAESITLEVCRNVISREVLVSEGEILEGMRRMLKEEHWVIEGAAGVALAAYLKEADRYVNKTVVVVICGRNVSEEVMRKML